jgi:hypothetical protein
MPAPRPAADGPQPLDETQLDNVTGGFGQLNVGGDTMAGEVQEFGFDPGDMGGFDIPGSGGTGDVFLGGPGDPDIGAGHGFDPPEPPPP